MLKRKSLISLLTMIILFTSVICFAGCNFSWNGSQPADSGSKPYNVIMNSTNSTQDSSSFVEVVSRVRTTCVDVYCSQENSFTKAGVSGSGVIVSKAENGNEYFIVTNHHVIANQKSFTVALLFVDNAGNEFNQYYDATLIGGSKSKDIAVLRITKKGSEIINVATWGNSDNVKVGEDVFAIGNPLGVLGGTVSKGIISTKARTTYLEDIGYMTLIQTDTATYQGSSGGALFNINGEVIGITNSGYSSYDGLNFAIPSNEAKKAVVSLLETVEKYDDGSIKEYGYVEGDSNIGITIEASTCYSSENSEELVDVLYVHSKIDNSDATGLFSYQDFYNSRDYVYFHAVTSMTYNGKTINFESATQAQSELLKIPAGTEVTFHTQQIKYKNYTVGGGIWGRTVTKYYLADKEDVKVNVTQYIYKPSL